MDRKIPPVLWLVLPMAYLLYFYGIGAIGLIGPDEPRYASIGREMAASGDWVTPRLWGAPWFEKPALLYWMIGGAFRIGLGDALAPRLPVALLSTGFLVFFWWIVNREFGGRAAWISSLILASSGEWLGFSQAAATDLPLAATFGASMLLLLPWLARGDERFLPYASGLLGAATLAKGLTPLVLAAPIVPAFFWARRYAVNPPRWRHLFRFRVIAPFLIVALPWYIACYWRNGSVFVDEFFVKHHFGRFTSGALQHVQPWWYYVPVLLAAMIPWTPLLFLSLRRGYREARLFFLACWVAFGFVFFSLAVNKLPGYILPLLPAIAVISALALEKTRNAAGWLFGSAALLIVYPALASILPMALASGTSRAVLRAGFAFHWSLLAPFVLGALALLLERSGRRLASVALIAASVSVGAGYLKYSAASEVNRTASARSLWNEIAPYRERICVEGLNRNWRYGLNYYSVSPLPECSVSPKPLKLEQPPHAPPRLTSD